MKSFNTVRLVKSFEINSMIYRKKEVMVSFSQNLATKLLQH